MNITVTYSQPFVTINQNRYDVLRTDAQIMQDMLEIDATLSTIEDSQSKLVEKQRAFTAYLDTLFGNGATKRIMDSIEGLPKGQALGLSPAIDLCEKLIADAVTRYQKAFSIRYGEEC